MSNRPVLLLAFTTAWAAASACGPKPLDPVALMREPVEWPVCLQGWMEERMRACPSPPVAGPAPPPADCSVAGGVTWRLEEVVLAPDATIRAAAPAELKRAEEAYDAEDNRGRERARKAYEASARSKLPAVRRHAHYMMGFLHQRAGRTDEALAAWIEAQALPHGGAADATARSARAAYIELFALEREPIAAVPSLRKLGLRLFDGLDRLAHRYAAHDRWKQAAETMAELRRRQPERACHHQLQVVDANRRQGDRNETAGALNQLLEELDKPIDLSCRRQGMGQILALGDAWRDEALDTEGKEGPDRKLMVMASQAYEVALARFPTDDLQGPGVCRHVTNLWYDRASLLARAGDWEGCATAYDDALSIDATGRWGAQGVVGAMTCHLAAYTSLHEKLPTLPQRDRVNKQLDDADRWRSTLRSFHRYLCVSDPVQSEARTEAGLARGEVFLQGGALWESVLAFRIAAFDAPVRGPAGAGPRAGARYAVVMDGMAVDDDCRIELDRDLVQLMGRHCPSTHASEACATIDEVHQRLETELGPRLP